MILAKQSGLRPAVVGAFLFAILSLTAINPACAQAAAPTDAHSTLTPAEAQRALDVLQDAGKRDDLIETLRSIVKVSAVPSTQAVPPLRPTPKRTRPIRRMDSEPTCCRRPRANSGNFRPSLNIAFGRRRSSPCSGAG